jgi:hypothetical protein
MIVTVLPGYLGACAADSRTHYDMRARVLREFKSILHAQRAIETGEVENAPVYGIWLNRTRDQMFALFRTNMSERMKTEVLPDELWVIDKLAVVRRYIPAGGK